MAAPTNAANVKKALANSEPSTHGTKRTSMIYGRMSAFGGKADIGISGRHVRDMPDKNQPIRGRLMSKVKFISSPTEIPAGQTFVLVKYGEQSGQTRNSLGLYHHGCPQPVKDY